MRAECIEAGIPYLYDPSMQLPRLERAELEKGCRGARILAGNDYEFGMMAEKLGISEADLRRLAPITVMTRGEAGALITVGKEEFDIPPAKPKEVVDPTGAGDAFRAGFILGMKQGLPWPVVGRLAALSGVYAIEHKGPQQHSYTLDEFLARYRENFGADAEIAALLTEYRDKASPPFFDLPKSTGARDPVCQRKMAFGDDWTGTAGACARRQHDATKMDHPGRLCSCS